MIRIKIIPSGEKVFLTDSFDAHLPLEEISALRGERIAAQLIIENDRENTSARPFGDVTLGGELGEQVTLSDVRMIAAERPVAPDKYDSGYLKVEPGIFPDLLTPLRYGGRVVATEYKLRSVWLDIRLPEDMTGDRTLVISIDFPSEKLKLETSLRVHIIDAALPEQKTHFTQWFYCDALANYYRVPVWSEEHWRIIENFARVAVEFGRDTLYTPLLTPALNTLQGFERTPTQLVGISVRDGKYEFDFSLLDRWIDMCDRIGVKYFEISHLFEQDHAKHSPKIYATVEGEYKRIFGWETLALDERYVSFLRELLSAFVGHMKARGDDHRCFYHISDEPSLKVLEHYKSVKAAVADILDGYVIMDAISDYEFYKSGAINTPVPTTADAMPFIEGGVSNLWVYYACCQLVDFSNSYFAMPNHRTRSIGMQLYKYDIKGFLHWGYNYYNNRGSGDAINPFVDPSGEDWVPAGDTYVVYPGDDGKPLLSVRIFALLEAMNDIRAMQLCESLYSRREVTAAIEEVLGEELSFRRCSRSSAEMLAVRERINSMIEDKLKKS